MCCNIKSVANHIFFYHCFKTVSRNDIMFGYNQKYKMLFQTFWKFKALNPYNNGWYNKLCEWWCNPLFLCNEIQCSFQGVYNIFIKFFENETINSPHVQKIYFLFKLTFNIF